MIHRRDDLIFRQEMKFRNKLVEYLTDWIMGNSHQVNIKGIFAACQGTSLMDFVNFLPHIAFFFPFFHCVRSVPPAN